MKNNRALCWPLWFIIFYYLGECTYWPSDSSLESWLPRLTDGAGNALASSSGGGIQIVRQQNYMVGYHEESEQPAWVLYELLAGELEGKRQKRSNNFRPDLKVDSDSASLADYRGSGYDRGHLVPAADMGFSPQAMSESFLLSNMSPQKPGFNRGIWKRLEERVRAWALKYRRLIIVTAGVVTGSAEKGSCQSLERIGDNQVWVPACYYKIIYDPQRKSAIAFLLQNRSYKLQTGQTLAQFAVAIDKIETLTGLDFFFQMHDSQEHCIEANTDTTSWNFEKIK